jgi:hypothetical protein
MSCCVKYPFPYTVEQAPKTADVDQVNMYDDANIRKYFIDGKHTKSNTTAEQNKVGMK